MIVLSGNILVSGGFDPLHVGHIRMFQEAMEYGDVIVALNSDKWLMKKKGNVFMTWEERKEILEAIYCIYHVIDVDDSDGTVCKALRDVVPDYFANGGDRTEENIPELELCKELEIQALFNVGGEKIRSSSEMLENYNE